MIILIVVSIMVVGCLGVLSKLVYDSFLSYRLMKELGSMR